MSEPNATQTLEVGAEAEGERLDVWLARALRVPRGFARRLIEHQRATLAGKPAAKGLLLRAGDSIEVQAFAAPGAAPAANAELAVKLLARAGGLVAIDKPAGWPTHPLRDDERVTALSAVLALHPEMAGIGEGGLRCGVVHRLDTLTSGVLLFATEESAWRDARVAFRERRVEKQYLARVHGRFEGERSVELRLESRGERVRVVEQGGRAALSTLRALSPGPDSSLVSIEMMTGFRHQIRATLAHLGHPVIGDRLYGSDRPLARHLLHALRLRLGSFSAQADPPADFQAE